MENQPTKPNFDFILNQQVPEVQKPQHNRKPLVMIGLIFVVFLVLIGFLALVGKKANNIQQVEYGSKEARVLLANISNDNVDAAYNLFQSQVVGDKAWFGDNLVKPYSERFNLQQCKEVTSKYQLKDTEAHLFYTCPLKASNSQTHALILVGVDKQTSKITKLEITK